MATSIEVNKQSVKQLLESGKDNLFVIPEYQRPYAWSDEQIQTLFDDLWEFATIKERDKNSTYFLGTVVSFENENKEQEIIDGQQRITSLFLLLRAIYTKLISTDPKTKEAENFIRQIEPAIWSQNELTGEVDYNQILLTSKVMNNDGNEVLKNILATGTTVEGAKDNYSRNYKKFTELFSIASEENPLMIYEFINVILNKAILLPIKADTQDTALTIFSTLNDRGLQLSDADIFKAKIYNKLTKDEKDDFIKDWKQLDEEATSAGESIQKLFYYNMFYLRAVDKDYKTTTPGVRKFYIGDKNKLNRLYNDNLINDLTNILNLWKVVNKHDVISGESWSENKKIIQTLDVLNSYPNEFWKYPVIIYYVSHKTESDFEVNFGLFLNKLLLELLTKYLITPTINAVKSDIMKLNVDAVISSRPNFDFKDIDLTILKDKIKVPHVNAVRMLLKILAYNEQDTLLPEKWEIEHILPQKWQDAYFINHSEEEIREKLEHLGNKLPFEKRLNIVAGNGYFGKKKAEYLLSNIKVTKDMGNNPLGDWNLDSIAERDIRVSDLIMSIFKKWNDDYNLTVTGVSQCEPTPEELALIEDFKKRGLIK